MIMAGPVSSASPDGPGWFGYVAFGVFACFVVWVLVRDWKRTKEIRQYAQSKGFTYVGTALPKSFPFSQTWVSRARSITNAVAGDQRGKELLLFDCTLGSGKGRRTQTVVAVRAPEESFEAARFSLFLMTEEAGDWTLVYRPNQLLPLEEIDALLADI
jgi:hypothetical protein